VRLPPKDGEEESDYINANWVDGLIEGTEHAYITTQGPLQETIEDFWRMIWTTGSNVIAMLTKEMENDRLKCTQYWPHKVEESFSFDSELQVTLLAEKNNDRLLHRKLKLSDFNGTERIVYQFQYMDWPDHGLPESTEAFREVLTNVDKVRKTKTPIVVHCSAGIGRTGTFCTVHSILQQLDKQRYDHPEEPPKVNILETVLKLRSQRIGMVQTKEQYVFCYKALAESVQQLFPNTNGHNNDSKKNNPNSNNNNNNNNTNTNNNINNRNGNETNSNKNKKSDENDNNKKKKKKKSDDSSVKKKTPITKASVFKPKAKKQPVVVNSSDSTTDD